MYIERPELLESIRKSILENRITFIYGMAGVGKTTICSQCLSKYFSNQSIHTIRPYSSDVSLLTHKFDEGIYVFEDFSNEWIDINIIYEICKIPSYINTKFIFISREMTLVKQNHFIDAIKPYVYMIEITPFSHQEMNKLFDNFYSLNNDVFLDKIYNITQGNVLLAHDIGHFLLQHKNKENDLNLLYTPCIVDKYGNKIDEIDSSTKIIVTEISDQLLDELAKNPKLLHNFSSYDFERVIARIFEKQGFSVEITPKTRDGGKDIFVAKQGLASFLFYVECKKYAPNKPVGIDVIQRLYGVISAEKANGGFIATTSYFTKPAEDYIKEYNLEHQLTLQDYNTISDILKSLQHNTQ